MSRCQVDPSLQRTVRDGFAFPLGVYPVEEMTPKAGFTFAFEPADQDQDPDGGGFGGGFATGAGGDPVDPSETDDRDPRNDGDDRDPGEFEQWPDRYVWDIVVPADRLEPLCRTLFSLLPGRVYPIVDVLGTDAFRELDPYLAYELVGIERFLEALRLYRPFLFEDGLIGFGAMSDEPFLYMFLDEHKILTVRAEASLRDRVDRALAAFDLKEVEQIAGADAAVHEHRSVLATPPDRPDLLSAEEILEELKDYWYLGLNIDPDRNIDDQGKDLGVTGWRCVVRAVTDKGLFRYAEVLLTADSLNNAHDLASEAVEDSLLANLGELGDSGGTREEGDAGEGRAVGRPDEVGDGAGDGENAADEGAGRGDLERVDPRGRPPSSAPAALPPSTGAGRGALPDRAGGNKLGEQDAGGGAGSRGEEEGDAGPGDRPGVGWERPRNRRERGGEREDAGAGGGRGQDGGPELDGDEPPELDVILSERMSAEEFSKQVRDGARSRPDLATKQVWAVRWVE